MKSDKDWIRIEYEVGEPIPFHKIPQPLVVTDQEVYSIWVLSYTKEKITNIHLEVVVVDDLAIKRPFIKYKYSYYPGYNNVSKEFFLTEHEAQLRVEEIKQELEKQHKQSVKKEFHETITKLASLQEKIKSLKIEL